MLFNSYAFIFCFLPLTLLIFFGLSRFHFIKAAKIWLVIASLSFYAYWHLVEDGKLDYLLLLLGSTVFNHQIGKRIEQATLGSKTAKVLLGIGVVANLCLIGYYKYTNFIVDSVNQILGASWNVTEIILPLAISFYTFTQIAYLVDAYLGTTKGYDLLTYSLFVSFFPQLIAGPILRHNQLITQFQQKRNYIFSNRNMAMGIALFTLGLSKKVLIADSLSPWVATVFDNASQVSFLEAWVGAFSYTFQLYFDFSGYSDMAIGLGWMFNIDLPINFNSPYKSASIIEFWRRWHITLSNFLRDYLYIPLGGNRRGEIQRYINLMITMLLGGLWHGAGWTFIVWGGMHGAFLVINHSWRKLAIPLPRLVGWIVTFFAVVVSWVIFRAYTLEDATALLQAMFAIKGIALPDAYEGMLSWLTPWGVEFRGWQDLPYLPPIGGQKGFIVIFILTLWVTLLPNTNQVMTWFKPNWRWLVVIGGLFVVCLLSLNRVSEFLYFQF